MRTEDSQDTRPETCQHHEEDEEDTWREYRTHRILVQKPVSTRRFRRIHEADIGPTGYLSRNLTVPGGSGGYMTRI